MSGLPSPFGAGTEEDPKVQCRHCGRELPRSAKVTRGVLAGPESAAEHLRNALMMLDDLRVATVESVTYKSLDEFLIAVRRRVAAALALLEER